MENSIQGVEEILAVFMLMQFKNFWDISERFKLLAGFHFWDKCLIFPPIR